MIKKNVISRSLTLKDNPIIVKNSNETDENYGKKENQIKKTVNFQTTINDTSQVNIL